MSAFKSLSYYNYITKLWFIYIWYICRYFCSMLEAMFFCSFYYLITDKLDLINISFVIYISQLYGLISHLSIYFNQIIINTNVTQSQNTCPFSMNFYISITLSCLISVDMAVLIKILGPMYLWMFTSVSHCHVW